MTHQGFFVLVAEPADITFSSCCLKMYLHNPGEKNPGFWPKWLFFPDTLFFFWRKPCRYTENIPAVSSYVFRPPSWLPMLLLFQRTTQLVKWKERLKNSAWGGLSFHTAFVPHCDSKSNNSESSWNLVVEENNKKKKTSLSRFLTWIIIRVLVSKMLSTGHNIILSFGQKQES